MFGIETHELSILSTQAFYIQGDSNVDQVLWIQHEHMQFRYKASEEARITGWNQRSFVEV